MATLLTIIQGVADRVGLAPPSTVVGNADPQARQLLSFANQEGAALARRANWQATTFEKSFTTLAQETQTGALPADYDRMVKDTFYDRSSGRPVVGPVAPVEWADYKAGTSPITSYCYRIRGNAVLIAPTPDAGLTFAFEYISTFWCGGAASVVPTASAWADDTDVAYLDSELMVLGVLWRYQKSRGLDFAQSFADYEALLAQVQGRDGTARTLSMGETVFAARGLRNAVRVIP